MVFIRGIIGEDTGLLDVMTQVESQAGDTVRVEIDSPGGYAEEGLKIYDYLKGLNRNVTTVARNQCGSIASVIFMAGTERIATCDIFIHNPFLGDVAAPYLTQDDLQDAYDYLEELKKKINAIYSSVSGVGKGGLQALMDNETAITPEQAVTLGLATGTAEPGAQNKAYRPVAKTSDERVIKAINLITSKMKKKSFADRIKNLLNGKAKNIDMADKDGNTFSVDIPSDRESQLPEVGDAATPDGTYMMEDGTTIVIADGVVTEVQAAGTDEGGAEDNATDVEALKAENAMLRRLLAEAQTVIEDYETRDNTVSKSINLRRDFSGKKTGEEKDHLRKAIDERKAALKPRGWNARQKYKQ